MDLNEIKDIIEVDGGKIIIVENGKPTLVVAGFDEYKVKLNKKESKESFGLDNPNKKLEELTIEDLPV
ncbi:MAG: hypothetical protein HYW70_03270 [Candidatus Nealsonbacteria bacterium]|nr:hypothetical protein [Candidatus Nealsonbacteria bacterium]